MAASATSTGLRQRLEEVVGRDHVRTDEGALVTFSTDATPLESGRPDAVVFPATAEEVAGVLRLANDLVVPVVPRGSGTNLSGEQAAAAGEQAAGAGEQATGAGEQATGGGEQAAGAGEQAPAAGQQTGAPPRIGLQDSCHLRHGLGVWREPRELIARVGEYVELPSAAACCGAAGSYAIVRPKDSARVLERHLDEIADAELDVIAVVNAGCYRQLQQGVKRRGLRTRVVHLAELLAGDWRTHSRGRVSA